MPQSPPTRLHGSGKKAPRLPRRERRQMARARHTADEWIVLLQAQDDEDPEYAAFMAREAYGLSLEAYAARTERQVREVVGTRRLRVDELLAGGAALEGKTVEEIREQQKAIKAKYLALKATQNS